MLFSRSCPAGRATRPAGRVVSESYEQSEIIVEMIITNEKCCRGFGFITQVRALKPPRGRNNDTCVTSRRDVAVITCEFQSSQVYGALERVDKWKLLVKQFTSAKPLPGRCPARLPANPGPA